MTASGCVPRVLLALMVAAATAQGQTPALSLTPANPAPGSLARISLRTGSENAVVELSGTMAGERLHFTVSGPGSWRAIGPVPVDGADSVSAVVVLVTESGRADTVRASVRVDAPPRAAAQPRQLAVAPRFTQPLDSATQARIERENARARELGRRAHVTAPMWTLPFINPRESHVTGRFGTGRVFNGRVTSRHLGVDFAGGVGAPVRAANRGVVALVDTFFLAGRVVYVDHGGGVVTGYFHLSESVVSEGETVERGQRIGAVGATGRVTGPHLHWSARYGALTVNPLDLVAIGRWYGPSQ